MTTKVKPRRAEQVMPNIVRPRYSGGTFLLTPKQRVKLLEEYAMLPRQADGNPLMGMVKELARKWNVSRNTVADTLANADKYRAQARADLERGSG